jgi:uncharacterized protein YbjT (DUF2867 family)
MPASPCTVFGGTGFLGRRIVRRLIDRGEPVRVAVRHPERAEKIFAGGPAKPEAVPADIHDEQSVAAALKGAICTVNAVSLYVETGDATFRSVHVNAAQHLARIARSKGIARLIQISGIGADSSSTSRYIRSRGEGELAVCDAFPGATILRPAVMFGPDDAFLTKLIGIVKRAPVIPLFGSGDVQLEPAYVDDVAEAAARILTRDHYEPAIYELGGPERFRYRELLKTLARRLKRRRLLVPLPMAIWNAIGRLGEMLPGAPLTRDQVELMRIDNVASGGLPGFGSLGIDPHTINTVIGEIAA